eukprot:3464563-Amphidinium_carterae.1
MSTQLLAIRPLKDQATAHAHLYFKIGCKMNGHVFALIEESKNSILVVFGAKGTGNSLPLFPYLCHRRTKRK